MNENENLKPVEKLTPFTRMIMSIGTLPSSFYASMSYYESMVWLYEYLKNEVIPTINNNGEAVEELQEKFIELKEWTETYTEETIPQEINNKLNEMATDGTLQTILDEIMKYKGLLVFNTLNDLKESTNIENGSFAKTLGYYSINDGGGATYKITDTESLTEYQEEAGDLYATLIIKDSMTPEMFGAYGDNSHDDKNAIRNAILYSEKLEFQKNKTYLIGYDIVDYVINEVPTKRANYIIITSPITINGNNASLKLINNPCAIYNGILIENTNNVNINDLNIIGDRDTHTTTYLVDNYEGEWGHCLKTTNSSNILFNNINATKAWGDGLSVGYGSNNVIINNCISDNSRRNGLTISSSENINVNNSKFINTQGVAPQAGVDIEPDVEDDIKLNNILLENCYSYNNSGCGFEVNTSSFGKIETNETINVTFKNCKSESCHDGISFSALSFNSSQLYEYKGLVTFENCYILNPTAHGCIIQYEKPTKTALCNILNCTFDGYGSFGLYGDLNHSIDTDKIWGGSRIENSKFINIPSDTGQYKCAIMWGSVGFNESEEKRYDLTLINCHVDDPNPLYWGAIGQGLGKIEWDKKPIVIQPVGYTHVRLNGLRITNRADNVGFILPSRNLTDREYELYCLTGSSCFVARYGFGDSSITTDDKIITPSNMSGSSNASVTIGKRINIIPYNTNDWLAI